MTSASGITSDAGGRRCGAGWIPCLSATLPFVPIPSNEMAWRVWLGCRLAKRRRESAKASVFVAKRMP